MAHHNNCGKNRSICVLYNESPEVIVINNSNNISINSCVVFIDNLFKFNFE